MSTSETTAPITTRRTLNLIEERIRLEKDNLRSARVTPPIAAKSEVAAVASPTKSCWERIRDQYQSSPDFVAGNRLRLNNIVGDWFYSPNNITVQAAIDESSTQGKFFLALAKAGLLEGAKLEQSDQSALILLAQVAKADPDNSAPLLYAAIIEKRLGNTEHADELLRAANETSRFDSYLKDFSIALFEGVKTPSDLLAAQELWSSAPVPNIQKLKELLSDSRNSTIANQLVADGLRVNRERITDLSWFPLEYAVGKKLLDTFGSGSSLPEYRELLRRAPNTIGSSRQRSIDQLNSTCDLESINDEVESIRTYVSQVSASGL